MKERLLEFLKAENKSSAQFAEDIGVQPSGISHILSGRNNPSLDFVLKMLEKYQFLSTDWLLFGKGSMYKDVRMQSLFDENNTINQHVEPMMFMNEPEKSGVKLQHIEKSDQKKDSPVQGKEQISSIERIVWFYNDNSFEEYFPHR
jgi:transcriptional regulator with XRE-family HTH domain